MQSPEVPQQDTSGGHDFAPSPGFRGDLLRIQSELKRGRRSHEELASSYDDNELEKIYEVDEDELDRDLTYVQRFDGEWEEGPKTHPVEHSIERFGKETVFVKLSFDGRVHKKWVLEVNTAKGDRKKEILLRGDDPSVLRAQAEKKAGCRVGYFGLIDEWQTRKKSKIQ